MHLESRQLKDLDAFVRTFSSFPTVWKAAEDIFRFKNFKIISDSNVVISIIPISNVWENVCLNKISTLESSNLFFAYSQDVLKVLFQNCVLFPIKAESNYFHFFSFCSFFMVLQYNVHGFVWRNCDKLPCRKHSLCETDKKRYT